MVPTVPSVEQQTAEPDAPQRPAGQYAPFAQSAQATVQQPTAQPMYPSQPWAPAPGPATGMSVRGAVTLPQLLLAVLVLGAIAVGAVFYLRPSAPTPAPRPAPTSPVGPAQPTIPQGGTQHPTLHRVGEVVQVGTTWQIMVESCQTTSQIGSHEPAAGDEYLVCQVTLQNTTQATQTLSTSQFAAGDSIQGYPDIDPGDGPAQTVAPRQVTQGHVVFEVPASEHTFALAFTPDGTSDAAVFWEIDV